MAHQDKTISISKELKEKYDLAKIKESWTQQKKLNDVEFMKLLLAPYPEPEKRN